jgi:hypothetical protein
MMWFMLQVMTMVSIARHRELPAPWPDLADRDDWPVWATARLAGAQYVISHNTRHFPPLVGTRHIYDGIEYVTTVEFAEDILGADIVEVHGHPLPVGTFVRSQRHP